ncbi:DUF421 domain-containing protein [Paenibacillus sp. QZ-Y1]|uniref:DUF421 domain-containing protein n=1 Tax=Paenibacillus sp. QZ-Y1 TaxID=3414511 RepID=UPI003F7B25FB
MSGSSKIVVEDGKVIIPKLKRMRYTIDQLEMHLRQNGISSVDDLETATVEPNGQLGYVLKRHARPVTIGDLEELLRSNMFVSAQHGEKKESENSQPKARKIENLGQLRTTTEVQLPNSDDSSTPSGNSTDIFEEVSKGSHAQPIDSNLQ